MKALLITLAIAAVVAWLVYETVMAIKNAVTYPDDFEENININS